VTTSLLVSFFEEILPSDLALNEGFFVSEKYISTSLVIIELSDLTEFCRCVEYMGYEYEEVHEEIEVVEEYLEYSLVT
jgi:hypothetical protein